LTQKVTKKSSCIQGTLPTHKASALKNLTFSSNVLHLYDVYATTMEIKGSVFPTVAQKYATERRNSAKKIGELELTSPMIVSAFGDQGVFFKHQRYEDR